MLAGMWGCMCLHGHNHVWACDCGHHILPFRKDQDVAERRMMWKIQQLSILGQNYRCQIELPTVHSPAVNIPIKSSSSLSHETVKLANRWPCIAMNSHSLHIRRANGSFPLSLCSDHPEHIAMCACRIGALLVQLASLQWALWMPSCHLYGWPPHCLVCASGQCFGHRPLDWRGHWANSLNCAPLLQIPLLCCWLQDPYLHPTSLPTSSFLSMVRWTERSTWCASGTNSCNQSQHNISFSFSLRSKYLRLFSRLGSWHGFLQQHPGPAPWLQPRVPRVCLPWGLKHSFP